MSQYKRKSIFDLDAKPTSNIFKDFRSNDDDNFLFEDNEPAIPDNQLRLPNGKLITFNDEQYEGIKKIRIWLKKRNDNFYTLAGSAGSGKSTIVKKILDEYHGGVVVSAPTHKACKVISSTTKKEAQTLHSLLGLRPDVEISDFNPNDPKFSPIAMARINDYNFVLIDEASMINKELYELILSTVKDYNTKILFIGDPAQIPPVGEKESVVFNQISDNYHLLTKIERQSDTNPILLISDTLRNNLTTPDGGFKRISSINENGEGIVFTVDKWAFRNIVLEKFSSDEFKKDTDYCKGIAWKNNTVMLSNQVVRTKLFGEKADIIEIGDVLMGYRTITTENQRFIIIQNSADYRVAEKSELEVNNDNIKGYRIKLRENLLNNEFKYVDVFIINSNDSENLHFYAEKHDYYRDMGKVDKKLWKKYYEFRRNNLLMKDIDTYRNGQSRSSYDKIVKDLDYGFFLTAHKAQGSTYSHTYVMLNDIENNWITKEKNQITYVALTRAAINTTVLCNRIDV
jgi:hypothetical protein